MRFGPPAGLHALFAGGRTTDRFDHDRELSQAVIGPDLSEKAGNSHVVFRSPVLQEAPTKKVKIILPGQYNVKLLYRLTKNIQTPKRNQQHRPGPGPGYFILSDVMQRSGTKEEDEMCHYFLFHNVHIFTPPHSYITLIGIFYYFFVALYSSVSVHIPNTNIHLCNKTLLPQNRDVMLTCGWWLIRQTGN